MYHTGLTGSEMHTLEDLYSFGLQEMTESRQTKLNVLISQLFGDPFRKNHVHLTSYYGLIQSEGLGNMKRPSD